MSAGTGEGREAVLAGRGRRLAAATVDWLVTLTVGVFLLLASGALEHAEDYASDVVAGPFLRTILIGGAAYLLTNGWWMARSGQTLGKALLGVAVVRAVGGARAGPGRMLARAPFFMAFYLPFTVLPLVDAVFILGTRRRCLHDRLTGTEVVRV